MSDLFDNPLALTSPHMRGPRVHTAQLLLAGHNDWKDKPSPIRTYTGRIDSEYGPSTAVAAKRAKFWLGYPSSQLNTTFGELLYHLLTGEAKLSQGFAETRAARLAKSAVPVKAKALALAEHEIGTKESPSGSNRQKYGEWYGMNGVPWCAIFDSWCISHAGHDWKYSYVPTIYSDAVRGRNGMSITLHPEPGDLVTYTFHGTPNAHVAFFHHWNDNNHYSFTDLGGNTGPTDLANGGEVLKQTRDRSIVHSFIRLTL